MKIIGGNVRFQVCVECMTYNQEPYIKDALDGFCAQDTTFPFVCIVMDDASTDGGPKVIREYLRNNFEVYETSELPNMETDDYVLKFVRHKTNRNCFFAVYFLKYNHYQIKKDKISYYSYFIDEAKYLAVCEGDDFWVNPNKLELQFEFLESHSDYSMCFHSAKILSNEYFDQLHCDAIQDRDYTGDELFKKWTVPTASIVYRKEVNNYNLVGAERILYGDIITILKCAETGKVRGFSRKMSVYRVLDNSTSHNPATLKSRMMAYPTFLDFISENFRVVSKESLNYTYSNIYFIRMLRIHPFLSKGWIDDLKMVIKYNPFVPFSLMYRRLKKIIKQKFVK